MGVIIPQNSHAYVGKKRKLAKCHVSCACHRLSTSINTGWEVATEECDEF